MAALLDAIEEAGDDAIEAIKQVIQSSPAAIYPSPRIATGNMINSVEKRISTKSGSITLTVGWLDTDGENAYFAYQEDGISEHYYWGVLIPGKTIPGMFSLRAGRAEAESTLDARIEQHLRRLF